MSLASKTIACVDHGLFLCIAELLAPHCARVLYTTSSASAFVQSREYIIGAGIEGVERIPDVSDALKLADEIDLWIFPDVGFGGLQEHLRATGAHVWGSGGAEIMELDRLRFKKYATKLGLDVGPYEVCKGMDLVRAYVREHPGVFLKTARFGPPGRGDFESTHCESYELVEFRLDEIEHKLGHAAKDTEFILEKPIEDAVELATDIYNVKGEFPDHGLIGLEVKAEGYVGRAIAYGDYPESLKDVNEALGSMFKRNDYANFSPIECRVVKGGKAFVLDPCLRFGRPPLCVFEAITNWPAVFIAGGSGEVEQPKFSAEWAAEACIYSEFAEKHDTRIIFPKELENHLKLSNYRIEKGGDRVVVAQSYGLSGLGSVVATGSTMAKAIAKVKEVAKELKGYDVKVSVGCFDEAEKSIAKMKEYGIESFG